MLAERSPWDVWWTHDVVRPSRPEAVVYRPGVCCERAFWVGARPLWRGFVVYEKSKTKGELKVLVVVCDL